MNKKFLVFIVIIIGIFFLLKRYELKKIDISQPIEIIQAQTIDGEKENHEDKFENSDIEGKVVIDNLDKIPVENNSAIEKLFKLNDIDIFFGNKNSQIQLVEYFSFTCYHCHHYHSDIFPKIKEAYIDTGKIGYVVREFIGTKQDMDAAIIARCKGNKKSFTDFQTILLEKQMQWAYSSGYRDALRFIGKIGGISEEQFNECLARKDIISVLISNTKEVAIHPEFAGTPSIFINGKKIKTYSFESISEAIEKELK
jgi:protein-disulfide isomerase